MSLLTSGPLTVTKAMKLWSLKMLFVWRWRLGYWALDAFKAAWLAKDEMP